MDWVVPKLLSHTGTTNNYSSIWPGIGSGTNTSNELIQAGTEQDAVCNAAACADGTWHQSNYFWFEYVPGANQLVPTNFPVGTGQSVFAEVSDLHGEAIYDLCNVSTNRCVEFTSTHGTPGDQFEWIVERKTVSWGLPPLANYGSVALTNATWETPEDTYGYVHSAQDRVTMTNNGRDLSDCLQNATDRFTCTWHAAS
ncbi:hypothetical protein GCM10027579_29400 [Calidifontibacter terrae]